MLDLLLNFLLLIALFVVLGFSADIAVHNIREIAKALKLKIFVLGILLGLFTTLPEMSVGINASLEGVSALSMGNIMGGVIVLIGLILGTSLILNKKIGTEESLKTLLPASLVILSPFIFGMDGKLGVFDGISMVLLYAGLIFYLYHLNRNRRLDDQIAIIDKGKMGRDLIYAIFGVIAVMLTSNWIVEISMTLLDKIQVSELFIGLMVFSIGTNLPEITITLTAWRKKTSELSLSHLISSAFTNIFVLGSLAILSPITYETNIVYYILVIFVVIMISLLFIFAKTDKSLSRREGFALFFVYIVFVALNIWLA